MKYITGFTEAKRHFASTISTLLCLLMLASLSSCVGINERLISASRSGDVNKIERLVEKGADVNATTSALTWAALNGHTEAIKLLLEKGADVNARSLGKTALIWAAEYGRNETVKLLIEKGADVNAKDTYYGKTALMYAAKEGHTKPIKLLIEKGADVNAKDKDGNTALTCARSGTGKEMVQEAMQPLIAAAKTGNLDKIRSLLAQGADVNAKAFDGRTALMFAAGNGQLEAIRVLMDNGADVNAKDKDGWTALMIAAKNGDAATIKHLIKKGADVNATTFDYPYKTALKIAEEKGHTEIVNLLQEAIQPSILAAAETGNLDKIKSLLTQGADVHAKDKDGRAALMYAARNGQLEAITLLIEKGADVHAKDNNGSTALMYAAGMGQTEAVNLLIEKGADVHAKDRDGNTALMYAAGMGQTEAVNLLIEKGADVNAKGEDGWTALMFAAGDGQAEAIVVLIENGADVNAKGEDGWTALMFAAENGQAEAIGVLLENGSDVNAKDINGNTALVFAARNGHAKAIRLLLEIGAHVHIGEDAKRHYDRGNAAVETAMNPAGYIIAIAEYEKAKSLAPAWADVYYNLALTQELAEKYGDAATSLKQYLRLAPGADNADEIKSHINKLEYQAEKVEESQNIIKKLTAPGEWRLISGENPSIWASAFRLRDGKLEGSIYQVQPRFRVQNQEWVWRPVSFNGKILEYNFIWYQAPPELNNGAPYGVSVKAEIVSTVPLRLKNNAVWSQQFGPRSISEYEFVLEKFDN